jgi:hypothetical protein
MKMLRGLRLPLRDHLILLICEALLLTSLLLFDRPLIRGDAVAYLMWTASLGKDFDMDLHNQAERFGPLNTYMAQFNPRTDSYASVFAWGSGFILLPSFWAARVLDQLPSMRINDEWFLSLQAYPFVYGLTALLEVNLLTMATLALAYHTGRRLNLAPGAAIASLAVVWGTPLYFYSAIQPVYSHAAATFAHTLAVFLFVRSLTTAQTNSRGWHWLLTGLAFGLATLTRWQLALSLAVCATVLLARRRWRALVWMGLGFGALAWHIPYTFNWMFGSPFAIPMDALSAEPGFLGLPRYLIPVLFAGDRGLFVWSPVAVLGLIGLIVLARRERDLALALLAIIVAQVFVNSGVRDWYGGEGFGLRRLTEIYPALAVGTATLLSAAAQRWRRGGWGGRVIGGVAYGAVGLTALYGLVLVVASLIFGYFTDPSFGLVANPSPATAVNVLSFFFFSPPKFHLIWPMMEHHFGPWAWTWPGP